jgi:hypothetical protein
MTRKIMDTIEWGVARYGKQHTFMCNDCQVTASVVIVRVKNVSSGIDFKTFLSFHVSVRSKYPVTLSGRFIIIWYITPIKFQAELETNLIGS